MKVKLFAGVAMAGLFAAGAASADPNGWYGAIDAGWHAAGVATAQDVDFDVENDWAGFARLGYRFTENWRVELEGGYRPGDIGEVNLGATPAYLCNVTPAAGACEIPDGEISSTSLMMNVIYDFGTAESALRPFIGLGAGVNRVNTDFIGTLASNRAIGVGADDSSAKLAAQAIAGLTWAVSDRAMLDLTYRYMVSNMEFEAFDSSPAVTVGPFQGRYEDSSVSLGLRYSFGAEEVEYIPPPPAPPVVTPPPPPTPPRPTPPPPPVRREFVVYFDWDRSDLTAEAQSVVTQAANYAKSGRPTRILIVGHADTSGSAAYNVGLSNRRARTVADAMVAQGVNGGVISLDGKGETQLARPTADGVREPLNRRATIDINF
ncbi:MAG: OmpW family outer membrane protein [Pseudomonadota bacterium]|nr:OmpW family outer membrane protein [Pseudomonadota bacterium]